MRLRHSLPLVVVLIIALPVISASAAEPARVAVAAQFLSDGSTQVTAVVTDARGGPVGGVAVTLRAKTTFGWLTLDEVTTGQEGKARITIPPPPRFSEFVAEVENGETLRGTIRWSTANPAQLTIRPGRSTLSRLSPQPGFISPYLVPVQVVLLGIILGGVWATYGYVLWLLRRLRSAQ